MKEDIKLWAKQKYPASSVSGAFYLMKQQNRFGAKVEGEREGELWSEHEVATVADAFTNPVYEDDIILLYLADIFKRSYNAIKWQKNHIFQKAELHRNRWAVKLNGQLGY